MRIIKIIIIISIFLYLFFLFLFSFGFFISIDSKKFKEEGNYKKEELLLFSDIAFPYDRIRKWDKDIKVEIGNLNSLCQSDIIEVDSIIKILSPLIHPIKISRVSSGGNLIVYRKVDSIPIPDKHRASGFCYIPPLINSKTLNINYAEVYDIHYVNGPSVCLHEFEHAIGLRHPSRQYPFYMQIVGTDVPHVFKSIDEYEKYLDLPYHLSDEEKKL